MDAIKIQVNGLYVYRLDLSRPIRYIDLSLVLGIISDTSLEVSNNYT